MERIQCSGRALQLEFQEILNGGAKTVSNTVTNTLIQ